MQATVVITTKNRRDDLRTAINSVLIQTARPSLLVIDDGSTDGTAEMLATDFPTVRVDRSERSLGLIVQRNRGAKLAVTDIVISIDDDAAFSSPLVVEQTLADFNDPRIGAVAIPFINVNKDNLLQQRGPDGDVIQCASAFIGTAHAVRRELFCRLGGYREYLFHQGEEGDYCIRLLDAGYVVRLGRADAIYHYESPRRDFRRMDVYGRRNDVLCTWYNVPLPNLLVQLPGISGKGLMYGLKVRRPMPMLRGLMNGYLAVIHEWFRRRPVRQSTYKLWKQLGRTPLPLTQIAPLLPDVS